MTSEGRTASPTIGALVREDVTGARSQPVASTVTAIVLAAVCAVVFATTGHSAASEAQILHDVDAAGARTLIFSDPTGRADISSRHLIAIQELPGVAWAFAVGPARDVQNTRLGPAGRLVAARDYFTRMPPAIDRSGGRSPQVGESLAGTSARAELGMADGVGAVSRTDEQSPVVGTFESTDPFADLNGDVLVRRHAGQVQTLVVQARSANDVAALERIVPRTLSVANPGQLQVSSPAELADLRRVVAGDVGRTNRQLMLLILATCSPRWVRQASSG